MEDQNQVLSNGKRRYQPMNFESARQNQRMVSVEQDDVCYEGEKFKERSKEQ